MTFAIVRIATLVAVFAASASPASLKTDATTRATMHDYARCVVKKKHDRASEMIVSDASNSTIMKRYPDLIDGHCLGKVAGSVEMGFGGDLYRYALADALVNADFAAAGETSFANRLPLAHLLPSNPAEVAAAVANAKSKRKRTEIEDDAKQRATVSWLSRYGECVVRQDPVNARLWLLTPPGGPEETSRIGRLQPTFNDCLGDGTLKFNRVTMRGAVAINYYRLAKATPRSGVETAK